MPHSGGNRTIDNNRGDVVMPCPCSRSLTVALIALAPLAAWCASPGADYPVRPIRLLVPQSPGASNDTITRIIAMKMSEDLGQQLVVDNRPGAGGAIAGELVAHAPPDGYTLYATATASQVIGPQVIKTRTFDPLKDFQPVSLFAITQNILVVNPSVPVKTVKDLVAYTKANPGKVNLANAGTGTQSHLAGVLLAKAAGLDVTHVPYKGGGPSVAAVVAGESHATITPGPAVLGHMRSGRLRALASGGAKRSSLTPDIPTLIESGVKLESTGWIGLLAPKGTPKAVVDKLHASLAKALRNPATEKLMENQGADPEMSTPAQFAQFIADEYGRFGEAIRLANLKPN
jgi:tripartite-type tricarboxylate transporter receptor subunit TctC